jgi:D-sedoheptulose 7-phosphate isomerase
MHSDHISYFDRVRALISQIDIAEIEALIDVIIKTKLKRNRIFVIGNGGSSALASHFTTDLGSGSVFRGQDYPIISLVDNSPAITAAANDFGYDKIFSRQLKHLANSGDLLIIISSSGNSKNLLEAVKTARQLDMSVASILGFNGGKLMAKSDFAIHVKSMKGEYGQVEDVHSAILHSIAMQLRARI